jgi:transglutaminase-like putative cysteine protease
MLLTIRHDIRYRYATPVTYSIQQFRVTPASGASQLVRHWRVAAPGKLDAARDAYGNALHTLVLTKPHGEIHVSVAGEVVTQALPDGRLFDEAGPIPLEHFTCATPLTMPDAAIRALAHRVPSLDTPASLIALAERIGESVQYRSRRMPRARPRRRSRAASAMPAISRICCSRAAGREACPPAA